MKHKHFFIFIILLIPLGTFSQNFHTLSGYIVDSKTGNKLDGIDIVVEHKSTGTISNYDGLYSLYLDKGTYKITYSGKGYKKEEITVKLNTDQVQLIELSPKIKKIKRKQPKSNQGKKMEILSDNIQ